MTTSHRMTPTQWALLALLSLLWGGAYFLTEIALAEVGPFVAALVRNGLGAAVLVAVVRARGLRLPRDARAWGACAVMGLLTNALPSALTFWGQTRITGGLAAILTASTPLWTVIVAHFLTRDEKITPARLIGVVLGLTGLVVIVGFEALRGLGGQALAQLAVVTAALSYAFSSVYGKRFAGTSPLVTAAGQTATSILWLLPLAAIEQPWALAMPSAAAWVSLGVLALFATSLASILFFHLLATVGANNTVMVNFLIPIVPLVLGGLFLGERLRPQAFVGMAMILVGLAVSVRKSSA